MAITEIATSQKFTFDSIKCDKKDIKYILNLVKKEENLTFVSYNLGKYTLTKIEDIDELDLPFCNYFEVDVYKDGEFRSGILNVKFQAYDMSVKIENYNDTVIFGLATRIFEYMKTKRKSNVLIIYWVLMVIPITIFILSPVKLVIFFATLFCGILILSIIGSIKKRETPIIFIKEELNTKSFLERNKDNIVLNIIFLILGAVIGYVIAILTKT